VCASVLVVLGACSAIAAFIDASLGVPLHCLLASLPMHLSGKASSTLLPSPLLSFYPFSTLGAMIPCVCRFCISGHMANFTHITLWLLLVCDLMRIAPDACMAGESLRRDVGQVLRFIQAVQRVDTSGLEPMHSLAEHRCVCPPPRRLLLHGRTRTHLHTYAYAFLDTISPHTVFVWLPFPQTDSADPATASVSCSTCFARPPSPFLPPPEPPHPLRSAERSRCARMLWPEPQPTIRFYATLESGSSPTSWLPRSPHPKHTQCSFYRHHPHRPRTLTVIAVRAINAPTGCPLAFLSPVWPFACHWILCSSASTSLSRRCLLAGLLRYHPPATAGGIP